MSCVIEYCEPDLKNIIAHVALLAAILMMVLSQVVLKSQVTRAGPVPATLGEMLWFYVGLLCNPLVILVFAMVFAAGLAWIAVLSELDLGYAYPLMSLTFVGVVVLGAFLFDEPLSIGKLLGVALIVGGVISIRLG